MNANDEIKHFSGQVACHVINFSSIFEDASPFMLLFEVFVEI